MEGINLVELVKTKQATSYRCLVEAGVNYQICPEDPFTDTVLKGA